MKLNIAENIKRLRQAKNITQEKLAEYLNISAPAVSKWERGETLPDITMVMPLASYFEVSLDELMGYDEAKASADAKKQVDMYWQLHNSGKYDEADKVIAQARKCFPNNFLVAMLYMHNFGGGRADPRNELLLSNAEEFIPICERILAECTDNSIRYGTTYTLAKIYKLQGDMEKAVACFDGFPVWHEAKGQFTEQLHEKYTDEFKRQVKTNMQELFDFAFNKAGKVIWYAHDSVEDRLAATTAVINAIEGYVSATGYARGYSYIAQLYNEGGKVLNAEGHHDKACEYYTAFLDYSKQAGRDTAEIITWMRNNPFFDELRMREDFVAVLEKHKK